jgi:hypothetical protein
MAEHAVGIGSQTVGSGLIESPEGSVGPSTDPVDQIVQFMTVL